MQNIILISLFGVLGILSRFGIDRLFSAWNEAFPASTLLINILGSALAGVIFAMSEAGFISENIQLSLLVGFCGGFTTFSAYALQTVLMIDRSRLIPALSYFLISPLLGLAAAFTAFLLTRKIFL